MKMNDGLHMRIDLTERQQKETKEKLFAELRQHTEEFPLCTIFFCGHRIIENNKLDVHTTFFTFGNDVSRLQNLLGLRDHVQIVIKQQLEDMIDKK